MNKRSGRPKHNFWEELCFIPKNDKGKNVALCPICNKTLQNTAIDRLRSHRRTCMLFDSTGNKSVQDETEQNMSFETSKMSLSESTSETIDIEMRENNNSISKGNKNLNISIPNTKKPRKFQPRIKSFLDVISEPEISNLNEAFAKLFIGCNLDPQVADSDYFKNCIKLLRPGYIPPSSNEISTTLLNTCYENLEKQTKDFNNSPGILYIITVNEDHSKSVVSLIRHSNGEITFLRSSRMRTTTEGVEYDRELNENVLASLDAARNIYRSDIYAIVSKESTICLNINCNVMLSMCNVEIAYSLADSILDSDVYQKANLILSECKQNENLRLLLPFCEEEISEQNPGTWMTHYEVYSFYVKYSLKLKQLYIVSKFKFTKEITSLLLDESFETQVNNHLDVLKRIKNLIQIFEKNDCFIGDAVNEWRILFANAERSSSDLNLLVSLDVYEDDIFKPLALTANFLDHNYTGLNLNTAQMQKINAFLIDHLNEKGLDQLVLYKEKKGAFSKLFEKKVNSSQTFWSLVEADYPDLAKMAKKIISIPASAFDLNCHFVKGKYASDEQLTKHVNLYYELRFRDSMQTNRF